ncbi:MAG: SPOR domain-containing protein [Burkholderiaceae bacterium]|nr:SPOR domain-containing protein [Burkholderiaceae bacterium]MEB2351716.1 SPOR domain-containing protein [Burkholderiaceae bacterium]
MRWLLTLLVLANLFTFAMFQGWLSPWIRGDREPQRLAEQRSPERLRVVPLQRLRSAPAAPVVPLAAVVPEPSPALSQRPGAASMAASTALAQGAAEAAPAETCVAFGALDEQRAGRLREALQAAGARVVSTRIEQASSYLVYAPPAPTRADTQQQMAALRAAGQSDIFVIQDGPLRQAISVGLFRSEETARALVVQLQERGETGLQIASRGPVTSRVRLQARWPDAAAAAAAAAVGRRFDATPRDCG